MSAPSKRIAILISGRGTNMARLIEVAADPAFPADIACVVSDVAEAPGLNFAASLGIRASAIVRSDFVSREAHEQTIDTELTSAGAEIVCLAGYMRLLSPAFVRKWQGRMINIHPALLPALKGLDTHRRALEGGLRIHGCSVHFVTAETDDGPIIAQAAVPVLIGDDEAKLAARVLKAEHQLYPLALKLVAEGKARMEGGRTVFSGLHEDERSGLARLLSPTVRDDAMDLEALARFTP